MPRVPRTRKEIDLVKKEILDVALEIIVNDGFRNFSMRKLASRLGMTAKTIYNYYSNKDEINITIRMRGFELLYQKLVKTCDQRADPFLKMFTMARSIFEFGTKYPYYYDLMVSLQYPKYSDYVGTELEGVALTEKESSLRAYEIICGTIEEFLKQHGNPNHDLVRYKALQFCCDIDGIISFHNSHMFREMNENPQAIIDQMIEDIIIERFTKFYDGKHQHRVIKSTSPIH